MSPRNQPAHFQAWESDPAFEWALPASEGAIASRLQSSVVNTVIVIPARYGSTRFPGKPLALIAGISLIERVYRRSAQSKHARAVYVATDDDRIYQHVEGFGGSVVRTSPKAETGTDRIAQSIDEIESRQGVRFDQVINVQGDEPLIDMTSVDRMIEALQTEPIDIVTLACALEGEGDFLNPDVVKVVADSRGRALYFSRAPIPYGGEHIARRHIGLYGFQASVLKSFAALERSALESAERLEQLRALENGYRIHVLETSAPHLGVDRPEDVIRVETELGKLQSQQPEE